MIIINRKILYLTFGIILMLLFAIFFIKRNRSKLHIYAGGMIHHQEQANCNQSQSVMKFDMIQQTNDDNEKYQRPSKQLPLSNPFTFQSFEQSNNAYVFEQPEEVIYAYYGILKEASNMLGYSGGCGTIGDADLPYPYAYALLTAEARKNMSLKQFQHSFKGIGHITFLQCYPLPNPQNVSGNFKYFLIEIEVITGEKIKNEAEREPISYFAYYYGIVSIESNHNKWKIRKIDYFPEEFLCAPYHGWFYHSSDVVQIVYQDNLKLIERITDIDEVNELVYIYAEGKGNQYRFDFVRLTNGHELLINESIMKDGNWVQADLLPEDWKGYKIRAISP